MNITEKIAEVARIDREIEALEAYIKSVKSEILGLEEQREAIEEEVLEHMRDFGITGGKAGPYHYSQKTSYATHITDEGLLPEAYFRQTPDKAIIAKMLKAGHVVEGAEIQERVRLHVINK